MGFWKVKKIGWETGLLVCGVVLGSTVTAPADSQDPAGGPATIAARAAVVTPAGLNDQLQPAGIDSGTAATAPEVTAEQRPALIGQVAFSDRLRAWDLELRQNARLSVELAANVDADSAAQGAAVGALWAAGRYDEAIAAVAALEATDAFVAVGVSWVEPLELGEILDFTDVRIGTRTAGTVAKLDYEASTKRLFAVINWPADNGWGLYRSTNNGTSWAETFFWNAGAGQTARDVDMAVVSGWVYVGYVPSDFASEGRLRRNFTSTGDDDPNYFFHVALDAGASTITDVAIESNADSFDNRIYYAVRQANNRIRFTWDEADDGKTFTEDSPAATVLASGGLDLHWNYSYATYYLVASYIGTDDGVHVLRYDGNWDDIEVDSTYTGGEQRTAISAWDDTVIVAYQEVFGTDLGITYMISYNGGNTWLTGGNMATGNGNYEADVTARGGRGTAIIFQREAGTPDPLWFRYRRGYASGGWQDAIRINTHDVFTGSWTSLNWTPPGTNSPNELSYGTIYRSDNENEYFDRFRRFPGDMNCDEVVNFNDINAFVLALSNPAGYAATYPDCDRLNGDINGDGDVDFDDINPFVALLSS